MKKILLIISIILLLMSVMSCGDLPETFTITYQGNGNTAGYPPIDNKKYKSGEHATALGKGTLIKEDRDSSGNVIKEYNFGGWNTLSGTHYNPGDKIEIKNINIILLAVWE